MNTSELDYELPESLIAQQGLVDRAASRLMVLDRASGEIQHRHFGDLCGLLEAGDCLVVNDSKVIPARFFARRKSGGKIEGLFLQIDEKGLWQVMLKNASRLSEGETIYLFSPLAEDKNHSAPTRTKDSPVLAIVARAKLGGGIWLIEPDSGEDYLDILNRYGCTPLPPYIRRSPSDRTENFDRPRYQTVYAQAPGSVAAPTAGLHFDNELLERLQEGGIDIAHLTLHVGLGTFKPVNTEKLEEHPMHSEQYKLDKENAEIINGTLQRNRRVVAVGTTSVRTLETLAGSREVEAGAGWTKLLITPGYQFRVTGAMLTNFHLPRTTLLALVCAFAGVETVLGAYRVAIEKKYRFYSYGDAMLIL
ncbi:MAG: tRNA preQ1(34) S-adenosylmethionine ribosyltransferase-isomerase QueA [Sedimentisphaerales bacterium]|nr:tRNA preQ1(34) S-adenosylmethionine ribosyltransferase-isomerase QueA [Sedimentisphaerales bacterium]